MPIKEISVRSPGRQALVDITKEVQQAIRESGVKRGVCYLFCPHTTAALTLNEAWDPDVRHDIGLVLDTLVPQRADYRHGEGNSPAHVKSSMMGVAQFVLVNNGQAVLGTWQGIYLAEFDGPRTRRVLIDIHPAPDQ